MLINGSGPDVASSFDQSSGSAAPASNPVDEALSFPQPRIGVIGVGGAGCNTIDTLIRHRLSGCELFGALIYRNLLLARRGRGERRNGRRSKGRPRLS